MSHIDGENCRCASRAPAQLHDDKEDRLGRGLDKGPQHSRGAPLEEDLLTKLSEASKLNSR